MPWTPAPSTCARVFSLGFISFNKVCGKDPHPFGPSGRNPNVYKLLRRQDPRYQGARMLVFETGAFYVIDRCYMDLQRPFRLHQSGAFYVTRAKDNLTGQSRLLGPNRSKHRGDRRSTRDARGLLCHPRPSQTYSVYSICRLHHRPDSFSNGSSSTCA